MELVQIVIIIFIIFAYSRVLLRFKDQKISKKEFIFWSIIWVSAIIFTIIPESGNRISDILGISRPVDLVIYVSIAVLFYLIFRIYVKMESQEQDITKIIREMSIKRKK